LNGCRHLTRRRNGGSKKPERGLRFIGVDVRVFPFCADAFLLRRLNSKSIRLPVPGGITFRCRSKSPTVFGSIATSLRQWQVSQIRLPLMLCRFSAKQDRRLEAVVQPFGVCRISFTQYVSNCKDY
jgi:hypothetical protein